MAYEESLHRITLPVAANSSAKQYLFMTVDSSGRAAATGAGLAADGVLQDNPETTGFVGEFAISGVSKVLVGSGGVTNGHKVCADSTGHAVDTVASEIVLGKALSAGVEGDIIPVLLKLQGN